MGLPHFIVPHHLYGPFPLCYLTLHYGKLLFDDDYIIVGVIDWSPAQTTPLERFVDSIEFMIFQVISKEKNDKILAFRAMVREHMETLENLDETERSGTQPSHILGTKQTDIMHRCIASRPNQAFWMAKLIAGLIYGDEISWEQLVRIYGEVELT